MHVAIDLLDPPAHRIHGDRPLAPDDELVVSIRGMGVLTPLLVTAEGNRYRIVDGLRRHEAALLLGLPELPIHVEANLPGAHALVATTATNLVRAPVPPTQQWRALAALQAAEGMPLDQAAAYLGMDPRHARRLARLGQLHPELLAVLERYEANPEGHGVSRLGDRQLGDIASAPPEVQLAAYEAHRDADGDPAWDRIADRCRVRRISAQHAIFDRATAGVIFDEDLFAEPGSADQFTTADIDGFIAAQRLALAELVDTLRPNRRWHVTEQDGSSAATQVGLRPVATHDTRPRLSGDVAEWIGLAIGANALLPRMDTEALLAAASGDVLRPLAVANGIKAGGSVKEMRRQLQGHAEAWRPPGAEFGVPGPKPLPAPRRRKAPEMEDAA